MYVCLCLSVRLSVCLSVCPSVRLSVCLTVCPSVLLSVYLSVCLRVLSIMLNDRSEISGNTRGKWNDIIRLNQANQQEWLMPLLIPFPYSLIRAKNRFVKNGTANFGRNIPFELSGPLFRSEETEMDLAI